MLVLSMSACVDMAAERSSWVGMAPGKSTKGSGALEQARQEAARALQQRTQRRVAEVKSPAGKPSPARRAGKAASRPRSSRSSTRTSAGSSKKTAVDAMDVVHDDEEEDEEEGGDVDEEEDEVADGEDGGDGDEAQQMMDDSEEEEGEEEEEVVEPPSDTRKRRKSQQAGKPSPPKKRRPTGTSRGEEPAENVVNHTVFDDSDYMDPRFHNTPAPAPAPAPVPSEPLFLPVAPTHPPHPRALNSLWKRSAAWLPSNLWNGSNGGGGGAGGGGGGAAAARRRGPSSPIKHVAFDDHVTESRKAIPSGAFRPPADVATRRRPFLARPPPPARPMFRPDHTYRQPPPQPQRRQFRVLLKHAVRAGLTRAVQGLATATVLGVMWLAYTVLTRPPCASDQVRKHGLFGECVLDKAKARKVKRAVQRLAVNDLCRATDWSLFGDHDADDHFLRQVNHPAEELRIDAEAVKSLAIDVGELGPELREWLQDHGVGLAQHSVYLTDRQRVVEAIRSQWALSCGVRLLVLDYALVFLVALLGLIVVGAYMVFRLASAKTRRRVEALKRAAMDVLVNEGDVPPLHVRDGILERLDQLPGMGGATRKHVLKLWPQVARLVEADSRVSTINLESYGRAELHWRWKGRRSLGRPPAGPTNAAGARAYVVA